MKNSTRREFFSTVGAGLGAAALTSQVAGLTRVAADLDEASKPAAQSAASGQSTSSAIDFRYSPLSWQTTYCFPDDPYKSLIGERGELRYGHPGLGRGERYFSEIVEFSTLGMESDLVSQQRLEAPGIPIIHTRIDRSEGYLELTTFATNFPEEGRVDNVIMEFLPRTKRRVHANPRITIRTCKEVTSRKLADASLIYLGKEPARLFMAIDATPGHQFPQEDFALGTVLRFRGASTSYDKPLRYFLRLPQEGQDFDRIQAGLKSPDQLLVAVRDKWRSTKLYQEPIAWSMPGRYGEFVVGCAQNILQAREVKAGKVNFQVGPTMYRGLWVVDGNFILEAARYLGYDVDAQQGLEATWARQRADGGVSAGAPVEHWKDTGIAMFSLARQAELSQDWSYFGKMQPQVLRGVKFLMGLREKARSEGSANGRYGLLPQGFGDGGLNFGSEFTNTLWVLSGLKAITEASDHVGLSGFEDTKKFYQELRAAFLIAARTEMRQHAAGFPYLPMLMKEDPAWSAPDEWDRPQPQVAQWALSHAIYPGTLFNNTDPIVRGHISLMQECTQEDVPAETGWLAHEGLWAYNAGFAAEVYLWAGLPNWAHRTFVGFLNHASPLYCWREEQPLRNSLVYDLEGDMPHNWASAECIRYLRHMLALEDGRALRLLLGITDSELNGAEPYRIAGSPTRFGRVSLLLEPLSQGRGWRLAFDRDRGSQPESVQLPVTIGSRFRFTDLKGARFTREQNMIRVAPEVSSWQATWTV